MLQDFNFAAYNIMTFNNMQNEEQKVPETPETPAEAPVETPATPAETPAKEETQND